MQAKITVALILALLFFGLGQNHSEAQTPTFGPSFKLDQWTPISKVLSCEKDFYYIVKEQFKIGKFVGPILEKYNYQHKKIYSKVLQIKKPKKYRSILQIQDQFYLSYSIKSKTEITYFLHPISKKTGLLEGQKMNISTHPINDEDATGVLNLRSSPDKKTIAFISEESTLKGFYFNGIPITTKNSNGFLLFNASVYNAEMEIIWKKQLEFPQKDRLVNVLSYQIDNDGNLYLLIYYYDENYKELKKQGRQYRDYKIIAYTNGGSTTTTTDIEANNPFINEVKLTRNDEGEIYCFGFSDDSDKGKMKGYFQYKLDDPQKPFNKVIVKDFSEEEIFWTRKSNGKGKDVSDLYEIEQIINKSSGGFYVITQADWIISGGVGYGDINVYSYAPAGEIEWVQKVEKKHGAQTLRYISFASIHNQENDDLYIIFNETVKASSHVILARVAEKEGVETKKLFNIGKEKFRLYPSVCKKIDDNSVLLYGEFRTTARFGTLDF